MQRILTFIAIALPFISAASFGSPESDHALSDWDKQIIATCLVLEAANQGELGMQAVASVIANRAGRSTDRYIKVVKEPYAFTSLNDVTTGKTGSAGYTEHVRKASRDRNWHVALRIVEAMCDHTLRDNTYGADHYSRRDQLPSWSHGMAATAVIGDHLFFKRF